MNESSWWSQRPTDGHKPHGKTSPRTERGDPVGKPYRVRRSVVFVSIWIDICQAKWRYDCSRSRCRMDGCTVFQQFLFHKSLGHVEKDVCTGKQPMARATKIQMPQRKKRLRLARRRKGEGGKTAAITLWPREPEPDCLLHSQFVVTQHQKYKVHAN